MLEEAVCPDSCQARWGPLSHRLRCSQQESTVLSCSGQQDCRLAAFGIAC